MVKSQISIFYLKIFFALVIVTIIYSFFFTKKFYGFEYEDAFINPSIASSGDYFKKIENFRTSEYSKTINGKGFNRKLYPGHYMPYSFYLYSINYIFSPKAYLIHKIGNFILLILTVFTITISRKKNIDFSFVFIIALVSSLPFFHIINSALIENISFFFGILTLTYIRFYTNKKKSINCKLIAITLIIILTIIKRENLIYVLLVPTFINFNDLKNLKIAIIIMSFIAIQLLINPFFTEGIESKCMGMPTFSLKYLRFQLPQYLNSLISFKGFILIIISLFFVRLNKKSIYILLTWLSFIVLYSLHYRSIYAIEAQEICLFETYRYLTNTIPLFYGVLIFSRVNNFNKYKFRYKYLYIILTIFIFSFTMTKFYSFTKEEYNNYHKINDKLLQINKQNKITVYDNFILISLLNSRNENINLIELSESEALINNKNTYIINRFNEFDLSKYPGLEIAKDLSSKTTNVYKFK